MFSSENEVWATPQDFYNKLDEEFDFDLDPCAIPENAKCETFFTPEEDGLKQNWGGVFCVLQSSIRTKDQRLGGEMLSRIKETRNSGCNAYPCSNRYIIFP